MDLTKVLAQLRLELEHLDAAIASLEQLQEKSDARRLKTGSETPRGGEDAPISDEAPSARRQGGRKK